MTSRAATTAQRLQGLALEMFDARGYDAVTVAQIARAAGVSHMTFFRHFPTKEAVVVDDVFDPLIARAVAAQGVDLPPLHRAVHGLVAALSVPEAAEHLGSAAFRTRIRLAAGTPALRGAIARSGRATEDAMARALLTETSSALAARAAAAAVLGAATAVLLDWAGEDGDGGPPGPGPVLADALLSLLGGAP